MRQPKSPEPEQPFSSTTFEWRKVKLSRPPEAEKPRAQRVRWYHLPVRDWRNPITVSLKYRGGSQCWIEVRARGGVARYPGYVQLVDVLADINRHR